MRITEAKRQWEMPSGSYGGNYLQSIEVLSGQPCNPRDRKKTLSDMHGQNTDTVRNAWADNAESSPFMHPFWGNYLKIYQMKLDGKQRRTKKGIKFQNLDSAKKSNEGSSWGGTRAQPIWGLSTQRSSSSKGNHKLKNYSNWGVKFQVKSPRVYSSPKSCTNLAKSLILTSSSIK